MSESLPLSLPPAEPDAPALDQAALRADGFTPEDLELLREAGLLRDDSTGGPWVPTTLGDVDWVAWRAVQLAAEAAAVEARAAERVARLRQAREALLSRYGAACEAIVRAHLPRDRNGRVTRKSLTLDRTVQRLRTVPGGPRLADPLALVTHIKALAVSGQDLGALADAVQVRELHTGAEAVQRLFTAGERDVKLLAAPVKQYCLSLPPRVDESTGELLPADVPGVEVAPDREVWSFE